MNERKVRVCVCEGVCVGCANTHVTQPRHPSGSAGARARGLTPLMTKNSKKPRPFQPHPRSRYDDFITCVFPTIDAAMSYVSRR